MHGFDGGGYRRKFFFMHDALDVFDNDDGVIDQNADGQHHAEHGHHVHRKAQHLHDRQRTQQTDGHNNGGNQGVTQILQEQEYHQEHQQNRFGQRLQHFADGHFNETRCVIRNGIFDIGRKTCRKLFQPFADRAGGFQRIGSRTQQHGRGNAVFAIDSGIENIALAADFHARHIAEFHLGTIGIGTQDDVTEFARIIQSPFDDQRCCQLLFGTARAATETAGGHLDVLCGNGRIDIADRQAITEQFLRIDPNAHGRFSGEKLQFANAWQTTDFIIDVAHGVIGQCDLILILRAILVTQGDDHQKAGISLFDLQPLLHDGSGQARFRFFDAVLDIHLCQIDVGARLESDGDFTKTGGTGRRIVIQQAFGTIELFFDDADDRFTDQLGRCARIGGMYVDLWRSDSGVLGNRQSRNGQQTGQRNEYGHHPGEIGTMDEKLGHERLRGRYRSND